jgi:cytochrome P450
LSWLIQERRAAGLSRRDLLTKLLAARDEDDGQTMTDKQVRDEVLTSSIASAPRRHVFACILTQFNRI